MIHDVCVVIISLFPRHSLLFVFSPLIAAVAHGQMAFIARMLSKEELKSFAIVVDGEILQETVPSYPDVNVKNALGQTPLIYAGTYSIL